MADFPAVFDLSTLDGSNGFRIAGIEIGDQSGWQVASAGDINGDGFDDIIIGAFTADPDGKPYAGESYVVFGSGDPFAASVDLADLDGSNGFRLNGDTPYDFSGISVASAGDVNGDGLDDIVIGAYEADPGGDTAAGESYVVFGSGDPFAASVDLADLDGSNGFRVDGIAFADLSGRSVASAGDVNGDGFDDIVIGAFGASPDGTIGAGESYVVFGSGDPFAASVDLADLDGTNGFRIAGIAAGDGSGFTVASAGDVNGDGFDDVILGASIFNYYADESYVVFGKADGFDASIDLAGLDGSNGFRLIGDDPFDEAGRSVASAGDINGDGFDDIIIGGPYADSAGTYDNAGESYVVFGSDSAFAANIDLADLGGTDGFRIDGGDAFGFSGHSVASAGDVNGDGFDDMIIGAHNAGFNGDELVGQTYVVFGSGAGFASSVDLAELDGSNGFRIDGVGEGDYTGFSVAAAGDVNDDGFDDMIVGAPGEPFGDPDPAGQSYVIFGRAPTAAVKRIGADADQTIRGGDFDDTLGGRGGDDVLVGDGGDDRLVGGFGTDTLRGGSGDDRLVMSTGRDVLRGGAGEDAFVLKDGLDNSERAQIVDFSGGTDRFEINAADFGGGLTPGALDPDAFAVNATGGAGDADDRFIYNSTNGKLFYDADGTGAGEAVLLARLSGAPIIDAGDFVVV